MNSIKDLVVLLKKLPQGAQQITCKDRVPVEDIADIKKLHRKQELRRNVERE